jgi:hypothetical protein
MKSKLAWQLMPPICGHEQQECLDPGDDKRATTKVRRISNA